MLVFNSEEEQREKIKKEDIQRFLSSYATRQELIDFVANLMARIDFLEVNITLGLSFDENERRSKIQKEFLVERVTKITEGFTSRAPLTTIL